MRAPVSRLLLAVSLAVLLGVLYVRRQPGTSRRSLRELGDVAVAKRLDDQKVAERDGYALFPFDHTHAFRMGSSRPITERLTIAAWLPATRAQARQQAIGDVTEAWLQHMRDLRWRDEGDVRIGEGVHEVNAASHDAWVLVRDDAPHALTVAYMVWKQDASLERARATVNDVVRSFRPGRPVAEYLAIARDRPGATRRARWQAVEQGLAARGVRLTRDGPAALGTDGTLYKLVSRDDGAGALLSLHYLGALPPAARYEALDPRLPANQGSWPTMLWWARDSARWTHHSTRSEPQLPEALDAEIGARHAADAGRAHFYAFLRQEIDDLDQRAPDFDWFARAAPRMVEHFRAGKMVR